MSHETLITLRVRAMALRNDHERVSQQQLIVRRRQDGGWNVDEDRDGGVAIEGVAAEEDGCDDASAEVTGQIGREGVVGEAPDHDGVYKTDDEWCSCGCDERVRGVKSCPDDDALFKG